MTAPHNQSQPGIARAIAHIKCVLDHLPGEFAASRHHPADHLIAALGSLSECGGQTGDARIAERLTDVVMMLDTPDAYARPYVAAVCRSILSSLLPSAHSPSEDGK